MRFSKFIFFTVFTAIVLLWSCSSDNAEPSCEEKIWFNDRDNDNFGNPDIDRAVYACVKPDGYVSNNTDCNDNNSFINPNSIEVPDGIDNNCDGIITGTILNFSISVEEIYALSAEISWTDATTDTDLDIFYDIYVNDNLVVNNLLTTSYTLSDLEPGTNQILSIVARYGLQETEVTIEFQTLSLDQVSFRLDNVNYQSSVQPYPFNIDWAITYHDSNFIKDFDEGNNYDWNTNTEYEGNNLTYYNGYSTYDWHYFRLHMNYDNDEFTTTRLINSVADSDFSTTYEYTYFSPLSCNVEVKHIRRVGDPDNEYEFEYIYYNINMTKNTNDRLINYTIENTETNEMTSLSFEYDVNNNLNRIIKNNVNILDITYDNQPNFVVNTQNYSAFCYFGLFTSGNLPFLDTDNRNDLGDEGVDDLFASSSITDLIKVIPELYNHTNTNNVTSYILNGTTIRSFDYQYYGSGLPQQMSFEDVEITINYNEIIN